MKISVLPICLVFCAMGTVFASDNTHFVPNNTDAPVLNEDYVIPKVLVDLQTRIIYYLESDGRHISAISPNGKLLWHVDPFVDAKLEPYRFSQPIILYFEFVDPTWWKIHAYLGPADDFIGINFNSSQFGALNKNTGKFTCFGQD